MDDAHRGALSADLGVPDLGQGLCSPYEGNGGDRLGGPVVRPGSGACGQRGRLHPVPCRPLPPRRGPRRDDPAGGVRSAGPSGRPGDRGDRRPSRHRLRQPDCRRARKRRDPPEAPRRETALAYLGTLEALGIQLAGYAPLDVALARPRGPRRARPPTRRHGRPTQRRASLLSDTTAARTALVASAARHYATATRGSGC